MGMSVAKIGWSGGKDSTCAFYLHLERGDTVKATCYIPMFTKEIPLITKRHYDFIQKIAEQFRNKGGLIWFAEGITYWDYVTHKALSGKFKGKILGFPCTNISQCGFKRDSKEKACRSVDVGDYDYEAIGICADEFARQSQLSEKKRSILVEQGYSKIDTMRFCYSNGLLSPHYQYTSRDGCVLCPNAKEIERRIWYDDYPQARDLLIELQDICKKERPDRFPLRDYRYFINTDNIQLSLFDEGVIL
jgi:hypothetical protein